MWLSQSTCLTTPILPPLPQSVPPRPSSLLLLLLHPFLAALHPSTGQSFFLVVSHLSFTFYLSFPPFPGFSPSLQLYSFPLPSFPELLYYFMVSHGFSVALSSASPGLQQNRSLICHIYHRIARIHYFNPPVGLISYFVPFFPGSHVIHNQVIYIIFLRTT